MTDNSNFKFWDQFSDIDPAFTKPISGKDYSGTSPNAHYIIKCLTEMFGPVGVGFGWRVIADGMERFGDTAVHWCRVEFWHTDRANTFESYGQTKMAYMTRGQNPYLKVDEDAPKKSLTDAITKAASQIGVAANIFLGRWDDNKYVQGVRADFEERKAAENGQPTPKQIAINSINNADTLERLQNIWTGLGSQVQKIPDVLAAKDSRKAALSKPSDSVSQDEIPY